MKKALILGVFISSLSHFCWAQTEKQDIVKSALDVIEQTNALLSEPRTEQEGGSGTFLPEGKVKNDTGTQEKSSESVGSDNLAEIPSEPREIR